MTHIPAMSAAANPVYNLTFMVPPGMYDFHIKINNRLITGGMKEKK